MSTDVLYEYPESRSTGRLPVLVQSYGVLVVHLAIRLLTVLVLVDGRVRVRYVVQYEHCEYKYKYTLYTCNPAIHVLVYCTPY